MLDAFSTFYPEVPGDHVDQTKLAFPVTMFRPICKSRGVFLLGQTVRYPPTEIWQSSSIFTFVSEDPGTWRKVGSCTKSRRKSVAAITCKRQIRLSFWCDTQTQTISLVLLATLVLVNSPRRIHYLSLHLLGGEECLHIFNSTGNAYNVVLAKVMWVRIQMHTCDSLLKLNHYPKRGQKHTSIFLIETLMLSRQQKTEKLGWHLN